MTIEDHSALAIRRRIAGGHLTAEAAVRQAFERIEVLEGTLQAWVALGRDQALAAARVLDRGPGNGGRWQAKQHIYNSPFYYIDYTLAQCCAMQFWSRARHDAKGALNAYVGLCDLEIGRAHV